MKRIFCVCVVLFSTFSSYSQSEVFYCYEGSESHEIILILSDNNTFLYRSEIGGLSKVMAKGTYKESQDTIVLTSRADSTVLIHKVSNDPLDSLVFINLVDFNNKISYTPAAISVFVGDSRTSVLHDSIIRIPTSTNFDFLGFQILSVSERKIGADYFNSGTYQVFYREEDFSDLGTMKFLRVDNVLYEVFYRDNRKDELYPLRKLE